MAMAAVSPHWQSVLDWLKSKGVQHIIYIQVDNDGPVDDPILLGFAIIVKQKL